MELRLTDSLRVVLLFILFSTGSSENDLYWNFCGFWRHAKGPLSLHLNITTGCRGVTMSANASSLSIHGQITAQCSQFNLIPLKQFGLESEECSKFCLYWEPLLDQLKLEIGKKNLTLCWPASMQNSCCTDLSHGLNTPESIYGIKNASVKDDFTSDKTYKGYKYIGTPSSCSDLLYQANQGSTQVTMTAMPPHAVRHPSTQRSEVEMKGNFKGVHITSPAVGHESTEHTTVYIPPALKQAAKNTDKVVCTFFKNNSYFQDGLKSFKVLDDVVEVTVENEVIADLSEPIKIGFHHDVIPRRHYKKCVSWDTRKDPLLVNWVKDGCETKHLSEEHTECLCNHLTYFTVLVQLEPRPVRHLLALTAITSLGCAVSAISCVALIIHLCRKSRRSKEQLIPIHLGLAVSLAFLYVLFFFTGVLANMGRDIVCPWVGAGLHYALLSSLTWMGIEVFHTFLLVHMVFTPHPNPYVWNLLGFGLPAVPIIILAAVGNIYGVRELVPSDDVTDPYMMCWMNDNSEALMAHYCTNMTVLAILVLSGFVMLFMVYRQIRNRDEWQQKRMAFFSIWGLSCLFGTTWGLAFLDFVPVSDFILFLTCFLNSFQGFFLMLRFYLLDWMRRKSGGSGLGSSSSGSTRQHMLQAQEKN